MSEWRTHRRHFKYYTILRFRPCPLWPSGRLLRMVKSEPGLADRERTHPRAGVLTDEGDAWDLPGKLSPPPDPMEV